MASRIRFPHALLVAAFGFTILFPELGSAQAIFGGGGGSSRSSGGGNKGGNQFKATLPTGPLRTQRIPQSRVQQPPNRGGKILGENIRIPRNPSTYNPYQYNYNTPQISPRRDYYNGYNDGYRRSNDYRQPSRQYYSDGYDYSQPNYIPETPAPPPVTKNTVVKKTEPAKNDLQLRGYGENATAETDALQVIATGELEARAEMGVNSAVAQAGNPELTQAWKDYKENPTPEALEAFKQLWIKERGTDDGGAAMIDVLIKSQEYKQDLLDGTLTSGGKDKALAGIQSSIDKTQDGALKKMLQGEVDEVHNLNNLGKLAEATQHDPNGLVTLMEGATAAGYPPSFVGDMVGMPIMDVEPVVDRSGAAVASGTYLFNPVENGGPINYALNSHAFAMEPGHNQALAAGFTISFDNGKGTTKKYTLSDASYRFIVVDDAWDLQLATFETTIDNSEYPADFHYVLNNEQAVVRAGETKTIKSAYPIDVTFDRGDGGQPAQKRLVTGSYKVGLDASQSRLDLFDEKVIASGATAEVLAGNPRAAAAAKRAKLIQEKLKAKNQKAGAAGNVDDLLQALKNGSQ